MGAKSSHIGTFDSQETSIAHMLKMAKVLVGLNLVDHPPLQRRGIGRKLVSAQRKKTIMACFRMAPLHSVIRHRAMNIFLRAYRQLWLDSEDDHRARLVERLCVTDEPMAVHDEIGANAKEATRPDPLQQLLQCLNQAASTAQGNAAIDDNLYLSYSTILSKVGSRHGESRRLMFQAR